MPLRQRLASRAAKRGGGTAGSAPPEQAATPVQGAAPQSPAPAESSTSDQLTQLQKLSDLHEEGVLTDEEFENQKAKILASL
jgi:hypothetical protein